MLLGKPLFPGRNVVHQLELITDLLGTPSLEVTNKVRSPPTAGERGSSCGAAAAAVQTAGGAHAAHLLLVLVQFSPPARDAATCAGAQ